MEEVLDSLARVVRSNSNIYSDLLSYQSAQFTILISVLCGLVVIIIGVTCFWNFWGAKNQISKEIAQKEEELTNSLEAFKKSVKEDLIALDEKRIKESGESIKNQLNEEQKRNKAQIDAAIARIYALHCSTTSSHLNSADWWLEALLAYQEQGDGQFTQISAQSLVGELQSCLDKQSLSEDNLAIIDRMKESVKKITDVLSSEKEEANKLLKKLKAKIEKNNE